MSLGNFEFVYGGIKSFKKKDGEVAEMVFLIDMEAKTSEAQFCDDETLARFKRLKELDSVKVTMDIFENKGVIKMRLKSLIGHAAHVVEGVRAEKAG